MTPNVPGPQREPRTSDDSSVEAALVARRYYVDGRRKNDIADEMGMSRFRVARLIEQARTGGLVRIEVTIPTVLDGDLTAPLCAAYPLRRAVIVDRPASDESLRTAQLGAATADLLARTLTVRDVLGISWGRTLAAAVAAMGRMPACDLVQLVGGVPSADLAVNSLDLLRRLGERGAGKVYPLHAPLVVDDARVTARLRADRSLSRTLGHFSALTVAVVGIGSWDPPRSSLHDALPAEDRAAARDADVVADICATLLDTHGSVVHTGVEHRAIAITADELARVPEVIAVAGGPDKLAATRAAIRSGLVHTLLTDADTARGLLADTTGSR